MSNITKRTIRNPYPAASHFGTDAAGRVYYVGKGGVRGSLWWAAERRDTPCPTGLAPTAIFGRTLAEISQKLAETEWK